MPESQDARLDALQHQWALYAEYAERVVDRRAEISRFHLSLNTAIVGAIGFLMQNAEGAPAAIFSLLPIVGIAACYIWRRLILSYRMILANKFDVLHELEARLPCDPYALEWRIMTERRRQTSVSGLEIRVPWLFGFIYTALLVGTLWEPAQGWLAWSAAAIAAARGG